VQTRTAFVTGTDSGVGAALLEHFDEVGWDVLGTSIHPSEPELTARKQTYLRFPTSDTVLEAFADSLMDRFPDGIGVFINNAAINAVKNFEDLSTEFIDLVFRVNVVAPVMLTQYLLKNNLLRPGAVVCNVVSEAAWKPMRSSLAYCTSKAAFDMATQVMARELTKKYNVSFLGVYPGFIRDTDMTKYVITEVEKTRGMTEDQFLAYWEASSITGIPHNASTLAATIFNLVTSPGAAQYSGGKFKLVP
jgi:NAD(P)-dependent dehydrogenase (short-subunit alcohol dehydrogenase family)